MRRLLRPALTPATVDKLSELTSKVMRDRDPADRAKKLWKSKPKPAFDEVRARLQEMAAGRARWCSHCNSNLKRDEFPVDDAGVPLLLDPTVEEPAEHLVFTPTTGDYVAVGPKGPESIRVFGLNDHTSPRRLPEARKQALIGLVALLKEYDRESKTNRAFATQIRNTVTDHPFSAVLHWLVRIVEGPVGAMVVGADVVALVRDHRVGTWL